MSRNNGGWPATVHPKEGALRRHGWDENNTAEENHRALERSVHTDGYQTTVDRLDYMANANEHHDRRLHDVARENLDWLRERERDEREGDDRRRRPGDKHRVRGFDREVSGHQERVRPHLARNPRRR